MRITAVALAALIAATWAVTEAQPSSPGCDSAQSHQFDFWVGRWSVSPAAHPDRHVADSLIEKLYLGCAVRENWTPLHGDAGGSLSSFVPGEGVWKQTWVDASGARVDFKGGWDGKAIVLTGVWPQPGHPTQLTRMTYSAQPDGSVRQLGESSDDAGKSWQPSFDFIYRKAAA